MKSNKFVDTVILHGKAGNGGNGSASFRREKFIAFGGPDGGDGGRGGHIILKADHDITSLVAIFFSPLIKAEHGGNGTGQKKHGRNGKDRFVKVPIGTVVYDHETAELLGDITENGQELIVANGGTGGKGNVHWKSSTHQAPTEHTDGTPGEVCELRLTLKIMSDVGLVGFPNAGKSSMLTAISDAHPKIGAYQFTTLNPIIGTLIFDDYKRLTMADIPGIITGAHEGAGLGHAFLKHIERAPHIIYVLDMAGCDGRNPLQDYKDLQEELKMHKEDILERPSLIVANKMDLPESEENLKEFIKETGITPICISATKEEGLDKIRDALHPFAKIPVKPEKK